jgi:hypothetical protein
LIVVMAGADGDATRAVADGPAEASVPLEAESDDGAVDGVVKPPDDPPKEGAQPAIKRLATAIRRQPLSLVTRAR